MHCMQTQDSDKNEHTMICIQRKRGTADGSVVKWLTVQVIIQKADLKRVTLIRHSLSVSVAVVSYQLTCELKKGPGG